MYHETARIEPQRLGGAYCCLGEFPLTREVEFRRFWCALAEAGIEPQRLGEMSLRRLELPLAGEDIPGCCVRRGSRDRAAGPRRMSRRSIILPLAGARLPRLLCRRGTRGLSRSAST